ncbi:MAG: flagellar hook-length control protein FliK, partial [Thermohalobaculum sp.]|nr:flagellar hook-length control protein FliK [Thermohalobaculum sp.]
RAIPRAAVPPASGPHGAGQAALPLTLAATLHVGLPARGASGPDAHTATAPERDTNPPPASAAESDSADLPLVPDGPAPDDAPDLPAPRLAAPIAAAATLTGAAPSGDTSPLGASPVASTLQPAGAPAASALSLPIPAAAADPAALPARQIAAAIAANPGADRIELRLDPPELGRVDIRFDFTDDRLNAVVAAERGATADLLRRHADMLIAQLREAGFDKVDLDFGSFAGGAGSGAGRDGDPRQGFDHRVLADLSAAATRPAAHPFHATRQAASRPEQALDLKV